MNSSLARRLLSEAAVLLMLLGVGAGAGLLLSPGVSTQRLPYGDPSLGRVATRTVRARRDYDVLDEEATRKRREEAQSEVRPVYDYDSRELPEVRSRIAESFAYLRDQIARLTEGAQAREHKPRTARLSQSDLEWMRQELMGRLQALVDPRDFQGLAEEGFSPGAEHALGDLVSGEMQHLILEDRTLLPGERSRGIYVRALPERTPGSEVVQDLDTLRDLADARLDVERAAADLKELPLGARRALGHLARGALRANLTYDAAETARRREQAFSGVTPVVLQLHRGEPILTEGERIEPRHLLIFRAIRDQTQPLDVASARLGAGLFAALLAYLCFRFGRFLHVLQSPRDLLFLALLLLVGLGFSRGLLLAGEIWREGASLPPQLASRLGPLGSPWALGEALDYAIPMTLGPALAALLLGPLPALLLAILSAGLFGLLRESSLSFALLSLAGSLLVIRRLRGAATSGAIFGAFLWLGLCNAVLVSCFALFGGRFLGSAVIAEALASFVGGALVTSLLCLLLLPLCELAFGYASDRRLLQLCNLNHPALKELIVRAPGTYHHSIVLAGLCEAAARAIGADVVLARAMALYHDVGKGKNPLAFNENQKALGRAELSDPQQAAEQLKRHIADGLEIARKHKVPRVVLDAIAQHHGTRPVAHFREQVQALALEVDSGDPAFVYQGPKPRTREVALLMLADVAEAASRTPLLGPSSPPEQVEAIVKGLAAELVTDGQFEESPLTLDDLGKLTTTLSRQISAALAARASGGSPMETRQGSAESRLQLN
jgi:putative nucleotidyltransferase with HDIG domain